MFKKKVWKRGDKLNAKELNRIEDNGIYTITVNEDVTNFDTTGPIFYNWSISPADLDALIDAEQKICVKCNIIINGTHVQSAWLYSSYCQFNAMDDLPKCYALIGFVPSIGSIYATLYKDQTTNEIKISFTFKAITETSSEPISTNNP